MRQHTQIAPISFISRFILGRHSHAHRKKKSLPKPTAHPASHVGRHCTQSTVSSCPTSIMISAPIANTRSITSRLSGNKRTASVRALDMSCNRIMHRSFTSISCINNVIRFLLMTPVAASTESWSHFQVSSHFFFAYRINSPLTPPHQHSTTHNTNLIHIHIP